MDDSIERVRAERIAELEARLKTPRRASGVGPVTAALGIACACGLLWMERSDLAYFASDRSPITLGTEGEYHFDLLASNRYAQIHGVPTVRGAYSQEGSVTYVLVGLQDTPLLVRRTALPGERWAPGQVPPRPDQRPFAIRGRLLPEKDAQRYREGFEKLRAWGEVAPRQGELWILVEGERPRADRGLLWLTGALLVFAALNGFFLVRAWRLRA